MFDKNYDWFVNYIRSILNTKLVKRIFTTSSKWSSVKILWFFSSFFFKWLKWKEESVSQIRLLKWFHFKQNNANIFYCFEWKVVKSCNFPYEYWMYPYICIFFFRNHSIEFVTYIFVDFYVRAHVDMYWSCFKLFNLFSKNTNKFKSWFSFSYAYMNEHA